MLYSAAAVVVLHFLDTTKEKSPFSFLPHCDDASAVNTLAGILINTFFYQVKLHCLLELQIFLRAHLAMDKMEHKKRQLFLDQLFMPFSLGVVCFSSDSLLIKLQNRSFIGF